MQTILDAIKHCTASSPAPDPLIIQAWNLTTLAEIRAVTIREKSALKTCWMCLYESLRAPTDTDRAEWIDEARQVLERVTQAPAVAEPLLCAAQGCLRSREQGRRHCPQHGWREAIGCCGWAVPRAGEMVIVSPCGSGETPSNPPPPHIPAPPPPGYRDFDSRQSPAGRVTEDGTPAAAHDSRETDTTCSFVCQNCQRAFYAGDEHQLAARLKSVGGCCWQAWSQIERG